MKKVISFNQELSRYAMSVPDKYMAITADFPTGSIMITDPATGNLAIIFVETVESLKVKYSDQSLQSSVLDARKLTEWIYLLVDTSELAELPTNAEVSTNHIMTRLQTYGVIAMRTDPRSFLVDVTWIADEDRASKKIKPLRDFVPLSPLEAFVMSIPGMGEKRALALLRYCGFKGYVALMALSDSALPIPGLPSTAQDNFKKLIGLQPDQVLSMETIEQVTTPTPAPQLKKKAPIKRSTTDDPPF